jgi:hypothetical protein
MIKRDEDTEYAEGCGYTGYEFNMPYPNSTCIEGFLWDLDSCDEPGGGLTQGGDIPCPQCNPEPSA